MSTLYYCQINIGGSKYIRGESKKSVLNTLFECREENLYSLPENDKERMATLTKNNASYEKLFNIIEKLPHTQEDLENVRNSLMYVRKIKDHLHYFL